MKSDATLACDSTFLVTDKNGEFSRDYDGFYSRDTRHVADYAVTLADNAVTTLELSDNGIGHREMYAADEDIEGARRISINREQLVQDGFHERITVTNTNLDTFEDTLTVAVTGTFDDIFEIRGHTDGIERSPSVESRENGAVFFYESSDGEFARSTAIDFDHSPADVSSTTDGPEIRTEFDFPLSLVRGESVTITVAIRPERTAADASNAFERALEGVRNRREWYDFDLQADSSIVSDEWHRVLETSVEDLRRLTLNTEHGPVLAAGTPWFATAFGRDSLISAYQTLSLTAEPAIGTLRLLADYQAETTDSFRAATPGKIMHEIRFGELAEQGIVPHSPYYGTIDATALFVVLLHETWEQTGNDELVTELRDNLDAALRWLDEHGDRDGDGFLEYPTDEGDDGGLTHQAWKDSNDGIVHPDGTHPEGTLAVAEAQGYYYDAKRRASELYRRVLDDERRADELEEQAATLADEFDRAFWLPEEEFYAVALDGDKEPIPSVTSNPGHCLWSGIIPESRADTVIDRLLSPEMFSGWGVRTLSAEHEAYNPLSYHLGSVWPHDSSLVALGMSRYGRTDGAQRIAEGLFSAAVERGTHRLPELFAGFDTDTTGNPVPYGAACEPQAWAAAAPLLCYSILEEDDR
ncbi:Glycogen debranching enzyme (alpha-1,6-glucosidase) [Haladaptatus litoreus]|uniref:Glycogen debranching enzyme (Alpha-1,6-glucosidase) n=1 Tax=Haladaptatus litoreus TaxID=553468 RepID=A0A1N7CQW4_9EURY|nr:glycogen debranching N-terminal domain-containing protein [Haladaptatus litoreus]SIR66038.1 Glycogen debranching enzyme (alpha-1,6-glucosidase) [Haladaptatus litoreus]